MKSVSSRAISLLIVTALTGCGPYSNVQGMGEGDYWIEQRSVSSPDRWDKVALVFGYGKNDYDMCSEFVEGIKVRVGKAPAPAQYRCVPAN